MSHWNFGVGRVALAPALAAALALSGSLTAQSAPAGPWRSRMNGLIRDTVLANGLTIIVAENRAVPVATVAVAFRAGAFVQAPGDEGVAHLYEHLLFRAYGDDSRFARDVSELNGQYNGSTAEESVRYYVTIPSKETEPAITIMSRLVIGPRFRDDDLEAERKIVLGEFERDASDVEFILRTEVGKRVWGAGWSRKDPLGTASSISSLGMPHLKEIFARYYVPNNAAVIVSGDVRTADIFTQVARRFGGWKSAPDPHTTFPVAPPTPLTAPATFTVAARNQQLVTLWIEWPGPGTRGEPAATFAADVFSDIVNSSLSPMRGKLVGSALVQSFSISYQSQGRSGPILLTAVMTPAAAERAIPALKAEIDAFASRAYVNEQSLEIARKDRAVTTEFVLERGSSVAHSLGFWWSVAGLDYFRGYLDSMAAVDVGGLEQFVRRYLANAPYVAGALAPPADAARIRRLMEQSFVAKTP